MGKEDAEVYVDTGKWKARQGGNGLASASDVKIRFTNCTAEDHAKIYRLDRPFDDELVGTRDARLVEAALRLCGGAARL